MANQVQLRSFLESQRRQPPTHCKTKLAKDFDRGRHHNLTEIRTLENALFDLFSKVPCVNLHA
jgi:hypothetical protein